MQTIQTEPYNGLYEERNEAINAELDAKKLAVTTQDGRIIHVPIDWLYWLKDATEEQRQDFEVLPTAIHWNTLDEGISMQVVLLGRYGT